MKFFFHDLEIFISKEKCRNISGSEMCVVKYFQFVHTIKFYSYDHSLRELTIFIFLVIDIAVLNHV